MTFDIALTLAIMAAAVVLFATEKLRVDVIALLVLLVVAVTGLVTPEQVFAGFASPAVITVWAVYIVSGGLFRTSVADVLGERIARLAGHNEKRLIAVIMITCGTLSAFMNNIGATAVLLPAVVGISRRSKIPLSRLLMPLSFASLMGGNMTLIGTPPNILATNILAERGLETFRFFDFTPTGLIIFGIGILYMVFIGRRLLPDRESAQERQAIALREYFCDVSIPADSPLAGQTLVESRLGADYDLTVVAINRGESAATVLHRDTPIHENDILTLRGPVENLMRARHDLRLRLDVDPHIEVSDLEAEETTLIEATLAPASSMIGRSLSEARFRDSFGYTALAIWRQGETLTKRLRDTRLQFGDALLLQGPRRRLRTLQEGSEFLVLEPIEIELRRRNRALLSVGIMAVVLMLATIGGFNIALAMVIGAVLMVLTRCLSMDEAYASIEWRSVFLIAGMLPLGTAMEATGTARFLAEQIVNGVGVLGPLAVLAGIYTLSALITQPMSNAAATVLMVPIAIDVALGIGANPQPFVLATVIGASTSFLTPVGHQANVLVFGPGGYKFTDYTRVGALLNIVLLIATLVFLPMIWPLFS